MCKVYETQQVHDEFISIAEAKRRGYGSRTTLWNLVKSGKITDVWVGNEHRLSVADLDRFTPPRRKNNSAEDPAYLDLVRRTVAQAPRLSPEQAQRLRDILAPVVAGE